MINYLRKERGTDDYSISFKVFPFQLPTMKNNLFNRIGWKSNKVFYFTTSFYSTNEPNIKQLNNDVRRMFYPVKNKIVIIQPMNKKGNKYQTEVQIYLKIDKLPSYDEFTKTLSDIADMVQHTH